MWSVAWRINLDEADRLSCFAEMIITLKAQAGCPFQLVAQCEPDSACRRDSPAA
jgi:hypothetical protein